MLLTNDTASASFARWVRLLLQDLEGFDDLVGGGPTRATAFVTVLDGIFIDARSR
jgi:hypothetical protein